MRIIVCTPGFDLNSGGTLVLDVIAHKLVEAGLQVAFLMLAPIKLDSARWTLGLANQHIGSKVLRGIPVINKNDLDQSSDIVIYPEVVFGNPCRASKVVRWLLNSPGKICATQIDFVNELVIAHATHFIPEGMECAMPGAPDGNKINVLSLAYFDNTAVESYFDNAKERNVSVLVRKGLRYHATIPKFPDDWLNLDRLPFEDQLSEMAKSRYVVSYDPYTMLSNYACLVGSKSIVVPIPGCSEDQWLPEIGRRTGIAYGIQACKNMCWEAQRRELLSNYSLIEERNTKRIATLIELMRTRFSWAGINLG